MTLSVSVVIPTYGREEVLIATIRALLLLDAPPAEILVVDQTPRHDEETNRALFEWDAGGRVRWVRLPRPSITHAMNCGLLAASGDVVLFLDDDIIPSLELITRHAEAHDEEHGIVAVAGQVLQPGEESRSVELSARGDGILADMQFPFDSDQPSLVRNCMAGNLSVRRLFALAIGGFDENFVGSAYRFESEFARRLWVHGGKIRFVPAASIRHLRAERGGTRARGGHMASGSPLHGVGDYYFALTQGVCAETLVYMVKRPFREVRTRFHLKHPWWIPVKFLGELRAMLLAVKLRRRGPRYIKNCNIAEESATRASDD